MPPYFFLSYSRVDADASPRYFDTFLEDLEKETSSLIGEPHVGLGFRDRRQIDLGEPWPDALAEALRTCRVFLALYSNAYFKSPNCGKEWKAFHDRCREHAESAGLAHVQPLILPVFWVPVQLDEYPLSPEVRVAHYDWMELGDEYKALGVCSLLKLYQDQLPYKKFLHHFVQRMVKAVKDNPLPALDRPIAYHRLTSAFHTEPSPAKGPRPVARAGVGPGNVHFLILAARSDELSGVRACLDAYDHHGHFWRPYWPASDLSIALLAQKVATDARLVLGWLDPGPTLMDQLDKARKDKTILVVVVDPWALFLRAYAEQAESYDQHDFWNGTVLIPWNEQDRETGDRASELRDLIDRTFENKATAYLSHAGEYRHFRGTVSSQEQFEAALRTVILQLRETIIRWAERPRVAVGSRVIPMPEIVGPGGKAS